MILTISFNQKQYDVEVDPQQVIVYTLKVLKNHRYLLPTEMQYIRNIRNKHVINVRLTYEEAGVRNGDLLSFDSL